MNHARICKFYYGEDDEGEILDYPEIKRFEFYFNGLYARDWYYNCMKYHAIHIIKEMYPSITLKKLGKIINIDHSSIIHYLKRYVPIEAHNRFISNYFDKFVDNQIYPLTPKNSKDKKEYGAFKPTTLEEVRRYYKPKEEKTRVNKAKKSNVHYQTQEYQRKSY